MKTTERFAPDAQSIIGLSLIGKASGNPSVCDRKDGKLVRIRPLHYDWHYDRQSVPQWHMEARGQTFEAGTQALITPIGLSYKKRVYSKNRILYPMKRVDWDPDGERNTQNRGKSKYVRISWDEAATLVAKELRRVGTQYGPEAVLSQADLHGEGKIVAPAHGCANKLLSLLGGYTSQIRNPDSWEGWYWGAKYAWGGSQVGQMEPNARIIPDICENADMLLFWGCDPEVTPLGIGGMMPTRLCYWFTQLGIKSVYVCPDLNYGAAVHADKWIPVLPNTDAALQLGIAYVWLTEGLYDETYIATHAYGFDKFSDYVLGKEDGEPKTPKWAEGKCGVKSYTIKAFARYWAKSATSILHGNGGPGIRSAYATEQARLEVLLLTMQGLGKPGTHQGKLIEWGLFTEVFPVPNADIQALVMDMSEAQRRPLFKNEDADPMADRRPPIDMMFPDPVLKKVMTPAPIAPQQIIPKNLIHDALNHQPGDPPITWMGNREFIGPFEETLNQYQYPAPGCSEVHMIWTDSPCWITCWNDSNDYIRGLRSEKIETIVAQHPWMENDCLFADILLPVNTRFEEDDIGTDDDSGVAATLYLEEKCVEPLGESLTDFGCVAEIAKKLGLYDAYTCGDLSTQEKIEATFRCSMVDGLISFDELKKQKYVVMPLKADYNDTPVGMARFCDDPDNNPVKTPTGKIEFSSTILEEHFPDDKERPPVPHWVESGAGHDERLSSPRAEKYPLLIITNHGRWRMHAQCDDVTWMREAPTCKVRGRDGYSYEPCWLNPADAKARGIAHGDIVKVFNERGTVLAGAYVTERIMPQATYMDHGARYDPIIPGALDRGGAINTITPHARTSQNATGMVVSSFLVDVQRVTDEEMAAWRRDYPDAFARRYDDGCGICMDTWTE